MSDFLRKYWFICLIAIALICGLCYYIVDLNKDNVSKKTADGVDVVASTSLGDVTSNEIFDSYQNFNSTLLYNMFQTSVVSQTVEADSQMKEQAKTMAKTIKTNMDSDPDGKTRFSVLSQLASYGFNGVDSLEDYCLFSLKAQKLDQQYIEDHFDELKDTLTTSPRTVSLIKIAVSSEDTLTDEQQAKKDSIDKALENGDSFADTATAFSEDLDTADKGGFFGYIDSGSSDLDSSIITAAAELKKGETSDWITVTDSTTGTTNLYKIHIDETDVNAILNSDNDEVVEKIVTAFVQADSSIEGKAVLKASKDLSITFDNEEVEKKIEKSLSDICGEEVVLSNASDDTSDSSKTSDSEESKVDSADSSEKASDESSEASSEESSDESDQTGSNSDSSSEQSEDSSPEDSSEDSSKQDESEAESSSAALDEGKEEQTSESE